jgi:AbrB family looped-hinge helix DNA binding protein
MSTHSTLICKGKTTLPKEIRDNLHMQEGDPMTFTLLPNGTVLMRVKSKSALDIAGRSSRKGRKALPIEDLSRALFRLAGLARAVRGLSHWCSTSRVRL